MQIEDIIKSLLVGVTGALCFLYGFQTRIPLPLWVLNAFNHPWIIFIILILIIIISEWNDKIGVFLLLTFIAIIIDRNVFMNRMKDKKEDESEFVTKKTIDEIDLNKIYIENDKPIIKNVTSNENVASLKLSNDLFPIINEKNTTVGSPY
jgi:hypothetical protein